MTFPQPDRGTDRQPIFNVPRVLLVLLALLVAIHLVRAMLLTDSQAAWVILNFAFFPTRPEWLTVQSVPGAEIWSYLTYAFLHASWVHLGLNALWMVAFGSPLAWRFGTVRFLAFSAVAAVCGAALHMLANGGDTVPMVGASAAVSAHMAGAVRFLFIAPKRGSRSYWAPAASLSAIFSDRRTLMFVGAWFAINLAVGLFGLANPEAGRIAWEAHVGGFAAGLLLFPLFDPVSRHRVDDEPPSPA